MIEYLPPVPDNTLMTKTETLQTVVYQNQNNKNNQETMQPIIDRDSYDYDSISSLDSKDNNSEDEINANNNCCNVTCVNCAKVFMSLYHHERHYLSK